MEIMRGPTTVHYPQMGVFCFALLPHVTLSRIGAFGFTAKDAKDAKHTEKARPKRCERLLAKWCMQFGALPGSDFIR
jgi:hypothetical protein